MIQPIMYSTIRLDTPSIWPYWEKNFFFRFVAKLTVEPNDIMLYVFSWRGTERTHISD